MVGATGKRNVSSGPGVKIQASTHINVAHPKPKRYLAFAPPARVYLKFDAVYLRQFV
jgi:hypothetical protein